MSCAFVWALVGSMWIQVADGPVTPKNQPVIQSLDVTQGLGRPIHKSSEQLTIERTRRSMVGLHNNRVCRSWTEDGTRLYDVLHQGRPATVSVTDGGEITVKRWVTLNSKIAEDTLKLPPDVVEAVELLGRRSENWSLELEMILKSNSAELLESEHPRAAEIYRSYVDPRQEIQVKVARDRPLAR